MEYDRGCGMQPCFRNRMAVRPGDCAGGKCPLMGPPNQKKPPYPFYHMGYGFREMPHVYEPTPYYLSYPFSMQMQETEEDEIDMDKIKEMFPKIARKIQPLVEEECDKMEYDGSLMFDEYPDKLMVEKIITRIYRMLPEEIPVQQESENEIFATNCPGCNRNSGSALQDLISVMLFQEMHRRRCRYRRCKRWW